jgi:hypothetical protein
MKFYEFMIRKSIGSRINYSSGSLCHGSESGRVPENIFPPIRIKTQEKKAIVFLYAVVIPLKSRPKGF